LKEAQDYYDKCIAELHEIEELKTRQRRLFNLNTAYKTPYDFKTHSCYYGELEKKRIAQIFKIEEAEKSLNKVKEQLVEVMKDRKKFEKLKEKQYEEYLYELSKEQDKELDDIISYKMTIA